MKNLHLDRPLVVFDLETTGIDPAQDRIVEIAVLRIAPDGGRETRCRRVNPERPIPPAATAVHGITDDDVRAEPPFRQIARSLLDWFGDADLAGFNVRRFDVVLLEREFADCGLDLRVAERKIVDAMTIFHMKERRDLTAAVKLYLGRDHAGAHAAEADVAATADVLDAQLERYADLPRTVAGLDALGDRRRDAVDPSGKFVWDRGDAVFSFGKHRGKTLRAVAGEARGYLEWIVQSDFPDDAKEVVRRALGGEFPTRGGPKVDQSA